MKFTDTWLRAARPEAPAEYMEDGTGLGLRVGTTGKKTWFARYSHNGKQTRATLGEYPAMPLARARIKLGDLRKKLSESIDPKGGKVPDDGMTVAWLINEYMEKHAKPNKRSWKFDETHLEKEVQAPLGARHILTVTKRDIIDIIDIMAARGAPVHAGRVLSVISKMFNWAVERDYLENSPALKIKAPQKTGRRERVLSEEEITAFWKALDDPRHFSDLMVCALRLMLVTGQRRGEVLGMQASELDLKAKQWLIPAARAKNGRTHVVPLSDLAVSIIQVALRASPSNTYLFGSNAAEAIHPHAASRAMTRNRDWLQKLGVAHVTAHDLRRTAATHMTKLGVPRLHVSCVLNHAQRGVTAQVYDRYEYLEEKRRALETWAAQVSALCH